MARKEKVIRTHGALGPVETEGAYHLVAAVSWVGNYTNFWAGICGPSPPATQPLKRAPWKAREETASVSHRACKSCRHWDCGRYEQRSV